MFCSHLLHPHNIRHPSTRIPVKKKFSEYDRIVRICSLRLYKSVLRTCYPNENHIRLATLGIHIPSSACAKKRTRRPNTTSAQCVNIIVFLQNASMNSSNAAAFLNNNVGCEGHFNGTLGGHRARRCHSPPAIASMKTLRCECMRIHMWADTWQNRVEYVFYSSYKDVLNVNIVVTEILILINMFCLLCEHHLN